MSEKFTLIGIDGGATKVSGWIVNYDEDLLLFDLAEINSEKKYSEINGFISGFKPVELTTQLKEMESKSFNLTDDEIQQIRKNWADRIGITVTINDTTAPFTFFPSPAPPLIGSIECEQTGRRIEYTFESYDLSDVSVNKSWYTGLHEQLILTKAVVQPTGYQYQNDGEVDPNIAVSKYNYKGIKCFDCKNYYTWPDIVPPTLRVKSMLGVFPGATTGTGVALFKDITPS